ncbi:glutamyl-tRNA reductase [Persicirhabdus sediminis]|uniref:Glutamyl-tRNA reductase n=1 Tax=Persicirhabdus sediminis TaxID=454144 RepID=A0A8J7MAY3_9BACT|nr:glutamyl-tRNA reductase [Persicirhabdus sediminis]MBK1790097.1 glutamyl-tRNA reductase [Persicirhabdus sediminis]
MNLICLGLNHQSAPVELRERFAVPDGLLGDEGAKLTELNDVAEGVVISTCNRMEIYVAVEDLELGSKVLRNYLEETRGLDHASAEHFYEKHSVEAAQHLCRVVSGLDSMVLGETEIFGQVKQAYKQALDKGATKGVLNRLFQKSFGVGKKVRTQTDIQRGQTSVGSVAVDLAEKIFGKLKDCSVMMIGAGEMGRTTSQSFMSRGAKELFVTNRSLDKAVDLAGSLGGTAVAFDEWEDVLAKVDVVVSSTGAQHPVLLAEHVQKVRRKRKYKPLFLIDIAVPRDIDPATGEIEEVYLYDMDQLQELAADARERRLEQVRICDEIIKEEVEKMLG